MKPTRLFLAVLLSLVLPSIAAAGTQGGQTSSDSAIPPSGDTARTSILPLEIYGRYYRLQEVIRLDHLRQPIPKPACADDIWSEGSAFARIHTPKVVMFTPGFSHIDYRPHDEEKADSEEQPPFCTAYYTQEERFMISDTTYINPSDSVITTSRRGWYEAQTLGERSSIYHLLSVDTSHLVLLLKFPRKDTVANYEYPHYEEMHYACVTPKRAFEDRPIKFFASHEAADNYLIPAESLPFKKFGILRYPPLILRPDTLRVGAEGGTFAVAASVQPTLDGFFAFSSYDGSERCDSIFLPDLVRGRKGSWLMFPGYFGEVFPVVVQPNTDTRSRKMELPCTILDFRYSSLWRPRPKRTLVILQEGAKP